MARYPSYITVKLHWRNETRDQRNRKPSNRYESPDPLDQIVFNTNASLPYNDDLIESLIVKERIKMDGK
ncbi:hypothetical protein T265_11666 [Opisthorchis viverrini]|uniref:Uncharacterized protein n=1 Tax=Opisthorchis viverrini TaxID=6198 RepID=A0A074ZWR1_OPIVI|nr:hypothetical protein T265_11666 [Opisthorchis viverrini]KER19609.1 hypothetical protein T265_11666 [Opisthorchis viverrini]